ncbi:hypothetical protein HMPREF9148_02823 [Prevotella sp. F0091]|nr:hypothetical protein HMPREF9148_02823 [Prevotella sp. F0091]
MTGAITCTHSHSYFHFRNCLFKWLRTGFQTWAGRYVHQPANTCLTGQI